MNEEKLSCLDTQSFPFRYTLFVIGGKWKMLILYTIAEHQPIRYNELQRKIGGITYKTLSLQLKQLEADGLLTRVEYPQIPPKVEYSLSNKGQSIMPVLDAMCNWGQDNIAEDFNADRAYKVI
ncbi:helix-turn-helix transcriptional regulator [Christensenellaceae bacterium OttesenSCG-928-L17]|nr:helix-turn-helix transcriptional regulator [Christensenellaceae bacterium OttesenSCG-928-L17]